MSEKVCSVCLSTPSKACSRCKVTLYCGADCQKKDFKGLYKKECIILTSLEHKDMCILMSLFEKLFNLFSTEKTYQEILLNHIKLDGKTRGIVHVNIAGGRKDLELITNKELMFRGSTEIDLDVKVLKVEALEMTDDSSATSSPNLNPDPKQWELAQDFGRNYTIGTEVPLVLTVPFQTSFFTRTFILELL